MQITLILWLLAGHLQVLSMGTPYSYAIVVDCKRTTLVALYSDAHAVIPEANPMMTDAAGDVRFSVANRGCFKVILLSSSKDYPERRRDGDNLHR